MSGGGGKIRVEVWNFSIRIGRREITEKRAGKKKLDADQGCGGKDQRKSDHNEQPIL